MIKLPDRIARLDCDRRGYPIPWNVLRGDDGMPFFTINDEAKARRALREGLCPICGERLGRWKWFVGGPRSAFDPNGAYFDLPGHRECVEFALQTCPHLALPNYLHRIDVTHAEKLPPDVAVLLDPTQIPGRPEIFVAVAAAEIQLVPAEGLPYLRPARPLMDWTCWRHGRQLNDNEALSFLRAALGEDWQPPEIAPC